MGGKSKTGEKVERELTTAEDAEKMPAVVSTSAPKGAFRKDWSDKIS